MNTIIDLVLSTDIKSFNIYYFILIFLTYCLTIPPLFSKLNLERRNFILYTKSMILKKSTYKTGEVAALLGVTVPTIIRYCDSGLIPSHKTEFKHGWILSEDVYRYTI